MSPTFLTHFLLHFLKRVPGQMVTNYGGQREYNLKNIKTEKNLIYGYWLYFIVDVVTEIELADEIWIIVGRMSLEIRSLPW